MRAVINWKSILGSLALGTLIVSGLTMGASRALASPEQNGAPEDWHLCRDATTRLEQQHNMPAGVVTAIAMAESGRRAPDGSLQAWPWTINAEGRAYYFATREDAVSAVRRLLAEGMRTIDVGCMQVNLRFHPRAFTSVEEAFDPISNVAYGSYFLRDLESRSDSWEQAIGRYHSFSPNLNERYRTRVTAIWDRERTNRQRLAEAEQRHEPSPVASTQGLRLSQASDDLEITGSIRPAPRVLAAR